ncbi:type IV pilin protein [Stenotrophomonas sp. Ker107b]
MMRKTEIVVRHVRGFSLLELMITCTVTAVLAAIGMPSYRQHVVRTYQVRAQVCMTDRANVLERRYTRALSHLAAPAAAAACAGELRSYRLQVETTDPGYTISAEPVLPQADHTCGRVTLDQAGRTRAGRSECW